MRRSSSLGVTRLFLLCSLWLLAGCGVGNAVLDGHIDLPPNPTVAPLFAVVEVVRTTDFGVEWEGSALPDTMALGTERTGYDFSVVSSNYADPVRIKVRFCRDERCTAVRSDGLRADPQSEVWVELETPLYQGEFTGWRIDLTALPSCLDPAEERCTEAVDPFEAGGPEECVAEPRTRTVGYPTWFCDVPRCDVECPRVVGATAGWCRDGDRGPHFCAISD